MKVLTKAFLLLQMLVRAVYGLTYAGYKTTSKVTGISSLDRKRCGEFHLGFEFSGYTISADGSCDGIPYGWSGVIPTNTEWIQKSWNCNLFKVPIALFYENSNDYIWYETQIPGDVTTGSRVEVVFEPNDPWNQIVLNLMDEDGNDIIIHVSFRKDFDKIQLNSAISGKMGSNVNALGIEISSGNDAILTLEVLADTIKVSVNSIEKYRFPHRLEPETTRIIDFHPSSGSNCLLKRVCFYNLKQIALMR